AMEGGREGEDDVVGHEAERRDGVGTARARSAVSEDHSLRTARGSRRVEQRRHVIGAEAPIRGRLGTAGRERLARDRVRAETTQACIAGWVGDDHARLGVPYDVPQLAETEAGIPRV